MGSAQNSPGVVFRCDASPEIGFGHLVRCLALADELPHKNGIRVGFAMRDNELASQIVHQHGYTIFSRPSRDADDGEWLLGALRQFQARVLIVDVRDDLSRQHLERLKSEGILIALLDDLSDRRFAADIAFYPPVPQVKRADWSDFSGELFIGWEWTILRPQFAARLRSHATGNTILITMGGSDPAGMTMQAVRAVELLDTDIATVIILILGAGFRHSGELLDLLAATKAQFKIRENVSDMRAEMIEAKVAICAYGMTAFELAACGVPALYLCLTEDHAESALALEAAGAGRSLGVHGQVSDQQLAQALRELLADANRRTQMSAAARNLMDGQGAGRIAEILLARIRNS